MLAALAFIAHSSAALATNSFVQKGTAGFVVTQFSYALAPDAQESGACPEGMTLGPAEIFEMTPKGKRKSGESDVAYGERLDAGWQAAMTAPNGENLCMNPELAPVDPFFRTVKRSDIPVEGMDIGASACGAELFPSVRGGAERIANQYYRAVGCMRTFQSAGQANGSTGMYGGSWGIVVSLKHVDDIRNDDEVEVGIYANGDPIQLSAQRTPLEYATYVVYGDSRFHAKTRGHIKDGVLTTEPVDIRFWTDINSMYMERPLRDARLRVTIAEDGHLKGYLAGYTPVEALYDLTFGFRGAVDSTRSKPAPLRLRMGSAMGAARTLNFTCQGVYQALNKLADGHPDPATGQCTSISTQFAVEAIPAFVIDDKGATTPINATTSRKEGMPGGKAK